VKPVVCWQVAAGDGDRVGEVLARMGGGNGRRLLLNGRPATADDPVEPGDRIELWPERAVRALGHVQLLAERDGIVVAFKPAGVPTETTQRGEESVVSALVQLLGGGRVHAASRLDVPVSGLVLCTLGRDAARRVQHWRDRGLLRRRYLGLSDAAAPEPPTGCWDAPLGRRRDRAGRPLATTGVPDRRSARTRFAVVARAPRGVLLRLEPETGRMHQLRAHAALAGLPLLGDGRYGGATRLVDEHGTVHPLDRIALQCVAVELPTLGHEVPADEALRTLWAALGGRAWPC
jgi:23S rRNA-/tRNA-specific pseudouridylate synthase